METLIEIFEETPWWVYVIFFVVFFSGIKATHRRTLTISQVFILPLLITLWSFHGSYVHWQGSLLDFFYCFLFLTIGALVGWLMVRNWSIYVDRERKTLTLPGSRSTLWLALTIFSIRYFFSNYYAIHQTIPRSILLADIILSGLIAGIFIGRALTFWHRYEYIK